jgi:KEOPS complex subunit Cgi121
MPFTPGVHDIRAARCTINGCSAFLRDLRAFAAEQDTHLICFNADMIAGRVHAIAAVTLAMRAFQEKTNISNTLEMEALLFAAGSRQCNIAAAFGVHEGENSVYICCSPAREEIWTRIEPLFRFFAGNWDIIDQDKEALLRRTYAISSDEIAAAGGSARIVDLVLERVALLQVMR